MIQICLIHSPPTNSSAYSPLEDSLRGQSISGQLTLSLGISWSTEAIASWRLSGFAGFTLAYVLQHNTYSYLFQNHPK